jgi:hypothetical protein
VTLTIRNALSMAAVRRLVFPVPMLDYRFEGFVPSIVGLDRFLSTCYRG